MDDINTKLKIQLNSFEDLELSRDTIINFCKRYCKESDEIDILEMSILEACHNAVLYGKSKKNKFLCELKLIYDNQSIKAIVRNYGKAFEVFEKDTFSIEQDFMQYKNGGLGIPLIKSLVDSVEYKRKSNDLNELTIIKKIKNEQ